MTKIRGFNIQIAPGTVKIGAIDVAMLMPNFDPNNEWLLLLNLNSFEVGIKRS